MDRPKRVLLISYYFAPQNAMGAVRPTKLAKYLARMGCEVTVLCGPGMEAKRDPSLARDAEELSDVRVIREWNPLRTWKARRAKAASPQGSRAADTSAAVTDSRGSFAHRVADAVYRWLRWQSDRSFRRRSIAELGRLKGTYDVVFSTYAPLSVHEVAREARRRGLASRWIADFRDEVGVAFGWQEGRRKRYMNMLEREADVLCAVSQGFLEMMGLERRGRVLSNGFDREDLSRAYDEMADDCLRVVYCGLLSMGRKGVGDRDLSPAFRALGALVADGTLDKKHLKLIYAGSEGGIFRAAAAACGLESCVEDHGLVSREESIRLQRNAHILLMASWHMAAQKGILTGKLFEYLMMDKPILCCISGDLPNSGIRQILAQIGMGLCCEQANAREDEPALNSYTRELVSRFQAGKPLLEGENRAAVEAYAYPALAGQLNEWMNELLI